MLNLEKLKLKLRMMRISFFSFIFLLYYSVNGQITYLKNDSLLLGLKQKNIHIFNQKIGFWEEYYPNGRIQSIKFYLFDTSQVGKHFVDPRFNNISIDSILLVNDINYGACSFEQKFEIIYHNAKPFDSMLVQVNRPLLYFDRNRKVIERMENYHYHDIKINFNSYYPNGRIHYERIVTGDSIFVKEFWRDGRIKAEGNTYLDNKIGVWNYFNKKGKILKINHSVVSELTERKE